MIDWTCLSSRKVHVVIFICSLYCWTINCVPLISTWKSPSCQCWAFTLSSRNYVCSCLIKKRSKKQLDTFLSVWTVLVCPVCCSCLLRFSWFDVYPWYILAEHLRFSGNLCNSCKQLHNAPWRETISIPIPKSSDAQAWFKYKHFVRALLVDSQTDITCTSILYLAAALARRDLQCIAAHFSWLKHHKSWWR